MNTKKYLKTLKEEFYYYFDQAHEDDIDDLKFEWPPIIIEEENEDFFTRKINDKLFVLKNIDEIKNAIIILSGKYYYLFDNKGEFWGFETCEYDEYLSKKYEIESIYEKEIKND